MNRARHRAGATPASAKGARPLVTNLPAVPSLPSPADKERHGWYDGRRDVLAAMLDRLGPAQDALDAGCGAGLMLTELSTRAVRCRGVDADPRAVAAAQARGCADVQLAPIEKLPFADGTFDLLTSFDVLEHTDDDVRALRELRRVARPGARLLVAVPALPRLWSGHDVAAGHRRRYTRRSLAAAARSAGWTPVRAASFNTLLLAPMAAVRFATRKHPPKTDLYRAPRVVGAVVGPALRLEAQAVRAGIRFPVGLSLTMLLEAA